MVRKAVKKIMDRAKKHLSKSKSKAIEVAKSIRSKIPKSLPKLGGRKPSKKGKESKVKKLITKAKGMLGRR